MERTAERWDLIREKDGNRLYEGFIRKGKPYGAGTGFYENGE